MAAPRLALLTVLFAVLSIVWVPPPLAAGTAGGAFPGPAAGGPDGGSGPGGGPGGSSQPVSLTIQVADSTGQPMPARAQVVGAFGHSYPQGMDATLLSHSSLGGYFYVNGSATLSIPPGQTRITITRGFEWMPASVTVNLTQDTTVVVTLQRFAVPAAGGWFGGDLHSHSRHPQLDYVPTPEQVMMVARAEGLSVLHVLDNGNEFTGGPHALSDSTTILYYSYEYRNQTCGHVSLPGLRSLVGAGCCLDPEPPYPMIMDLLAQVHAQPGALVVLAHPHNTNNYTMTNDWPGAGLGRELPVLAALGGLDALDVASYSNQPALDTADWFTLMESGIFPVPSAGTDAVLNRYGDAPPGGWRVYAREPAGAALDYDTWLAAYATGHCFITSFPLVSDFTVGGSGMGDALEVAGDSLLAPVHLSVSSAIGLQEVALVADGQEIWSQAFSNGAAPSAFDTTFDLHAARPGWVLLRVDGVPGNAFSAAQLPQAFTNAVRVTHDGALAQHADAMGHMLDGVNLFESFASHHYSWPVPWELDSLLARTGRARQVFARPFLTPPAPFALLTPAPGGSTSEALTWQAAQDPDDQDRVTYTVRVASDSTMADAWVTQTTETAMDDLPLARGSWYWWSVDATDRAGNVVHSSPPVSQFLVASNNAGLPAAVRTERPRALPNPSRGAVWLRGMGPDAAVYDMAGRRVAGPGHGVLWSEGTPVWDGSWNGQPAPAGIYLARSASTRRPVRIVRLR